ncbi:hypothetical protein G6F46_000065 [Rhizopus delemar]|uniref:Yeast cell wall synthesis Kre9/Knh1-like N-terminal domain-containing protein n=3 Tax=Rhizopus TaxID=4842 RepID=I1BPQ3_RHIO9|nr:hypothetical protein RO3G_02887 [Rhizopus delemar RA 99-880]KAG1057283.1 hypothetical protein G6F43_000885 [Rhizopus delemar]KAG1553752.1 hypothetical protein G6F51_000390 [Rhizopus arrhizus]KAG1466775.1 hypothetical protein G6F55_000260 [Rhizopus delemar]KAG1505765.1 hypothetical protein G6F54_000076 [Rhizopus delemar]|eukprot:EIE78183.1 hypothetical protein RO3G_02887 [Rhizopus delemar RA 99-880]
MKTSFFAAAGLVSAASQALASITVVSPWGTSVWSAGGHGEITWNATTPESTLNCDIQLMNGEAKNANLVAQVTDPSTPIACSAGKYDIHPLNDFAAGKYSIRIGQASTGNWYYSGLFTFNGTGSSKPISVVSTATSLSGTAAAAAAAATGNPAASGNAAAIGKAAASGSAASASASATALSTKSAANAISINSAALALGAVAAAAFAL